MREEGQSIFRDTETLCDLLDECEMMMTKANRIVYLTSAKKLAEDMLVDFVMAYRFKPEQYYYFMKLYATYCATLARVRRIINKGRLTSPNPNTHKRPPTIEKEIAECLDRIEKGLGKWRTRIIVNGQDPGRMRPGQEEKPKGASAFMQSL